MWIILIRYIWSNIKICVAVCENYILCIRTRTLFGVFFSLLLQQASRAQILDKATEYIQYMRRKNHTHQQDIDDLRRQNALLEQQGQYAQVEVFIFIVMLKVMLSHNKALYMRFMDQHLIICWIKWCWCLRSLKVLYVGSMYKFSCSHLVFLPWNDTLYKIEVDQ